MVSTLIAKKSWAMACAYVGIMLFGGPAMAASSLSLSDRVMAELLDNHTAGKVYQQANNPWPGGSYKLEVFKNGKPKIVSGSGTITLQMPLKIAITGNAASTLLQMKMACSTSFTTVGEIELTARDSDNIDALKSRINLPIPAVVADCDGVKLPVDTYLKAAVAQNQQQWQRDIDQKINAWLNGEATPVAAASAKADQ